MASVTFPVNPVDGDVFTSQKVTYVYKADKGIWKATLRRSAAARSSNLVLPFYDNISDLPPPGQARGQTAFVTGNSRLYLSNGEGWSNISAAVVE